MSPAAERENAETRPRLGSSAATRRLVLTRRSSFDIALCLLIGVAALVLSLAHPWSDATVGEAQFGDAAYWDLGAESWTRGYVTTKTPDIRPGFSLFMGIVYALFGIDVSRALAAHAALFAVGAMMLYWMGAWIGGRLTGLLAAGLYALNPYQWEWAATTTTDMLGSIMNLAALFFLVGALRGRGRPVSAALFGVCLAFANIIRIFTLPVIGPGGLLMLLIRAPWQRRFLLVLAALAAFLLGLLPGVLYQYVSTGDFEVSSNSASAIYAASSPHHRVWTPEIYTDVAAGLEARGIPPTAKNMDAEFRRLALQNYLAYPWFQITRIWEGFYEYATFEGQAHRPPQYGYFYRADILGTVIAALAVVAVAGLFRARRWPAILGAVVVVGLFWVPLRPLIGPQATSSVEALFGPPPVGVLAPFWVPHQALFGLQLVAAAVPVVWLLRRRSPRQLGAVAVGIFWAATGLFAVLSAGVTAGLLFRLYLQVDSMRALLLALAVTYAIALVIPNRVTRARLLQLHVLVRPMPRLPAVVRPALAAAAGAVVLLFVVGALKLTATNLFPPDDGGPFEAPSQAELSQLAQRLGLPEPLRYLDNADPAGFNETIGMLQPATPPTALVGYAVPGQFTRFIWYVEDQHRTLSWYVFANRPRPPSLDRTLLITEALDKLPVASFRDRQGLLIVAPIGPYFAGTGELRQLNATPARAFVPWDARARRFQPDQAIVFPVSLHLYDPYYFGKARKTGQIQPMGSVRMAIEDRLLPAILLQPDPTSAPGQAEAAITYPDLLLPPRARFQGWASVHPAMFRHATLGRPRVELLVRADGREDTVGERVLDPMNVQELIYLPFDVDLSSYQGQRIDLTIRMVGDPIATTLGQVVIGDPKIVMP